MIDSRRASIRCVHVAAKPADTVRVRLLDGRRPISPALTLHGYRPVLPAVPCSPSFGEKSVPDWCSNVSFHGRMLRRLIAYWRPPCAAVRSGRAIAFVGQPVPERTTPMATQGAPTLPARDERFAALGITRALLGRTDNWPRRCRCEVPVRSQFGLSGSPLGLARGEWARRRM
jgi:hypothetical protein